MSIFNSRPALRWLVPAAAMVVVVGGGAAIGTFSASAEPSLPARSAAQLLVDLQTARLDGLSGTVKQQADLGLPALPNLGGGGRGSADLSALVSGAHTLRVWYAGPDKTRVALLGTLGESDVIRNGSDLWFWSSQQNTASHTKLPVSNGKPADLPPGVPNTPQEAADQALAAIDSSTEVTVGRSATIAGRDAYELVLSPRDDASLVRVVRIAIDATEHVPLRFEVFAKNSDEPVFAVAFTQVDFDRPDDAQFTFNPPADTKVTEESAPTTPHRDLGEKKDGLRLVGTGWTSVLVADGSALDAPGKDDAAKDDPARDEAKQLDGLLNQLPKVSGDWGSGRLVTTKLFNVLVTDDNRLLVGAVSPERLYEAARGGK